jgi:hypothetical protein
MIHDGRLAFWDPCLPAEEGKRPVAQVIDDSASALGAQGR